MRSFQLFLCKIPAEKRCTGAGLVLQRACSNGQRALSSSAPCQFLSVLIWAPKKVFLIFLYSTCKSQVRNASAALWCTHGGIATVIVTQNLESLMGLRE